MLEVNSSTTYILKSYEAGLTKLNKFLKRFNKIGTYFAILIY